MFIAYKKLLAMQLSWVIITDFRNLFSFKVMYFEANVIIL